MILVNFFLSILHLKRIMVDLRSLCVGDQQVEPSPTTGNFPLAPIKEEGSEQESGVNYVFKPFPKVGTRRLKLATFEGFFLLAYF